MRKFYLEPKLSYILFGNDEIMAVSTGDIVNLEVGENEVGNWWNG